MSSRWGEDVFCFNNNVADQAIAEPGYKGDRNTNISPTGVCKTIQIKNT